MPPTRLFWLECIDSDLPPDDNWLSDGEIACFRKNWVPKRRRDWLLGRWTAKCAIAAHLELPFDTATFRSVSIVPAATGAPTLLMLGEPMEISLSLSHRDGRALAVISSQHALIGCDLEKSEPRSRAFVEHMFTPSEIEQAEILNAANWSGVETLIWSAKESVLKALAVGLRVDTRYVSVSIDHANEAVTVWQRFSAVIADGRSFAGWWYCDGTWIRTIAYCGDSSPPLRLDLSTSGADCMVLKTETSV